MTKTADVRYIVVGIGKDRMIKGIEKLGSELDVRTFPHRKELDDGEIRVALARTRQNPHPAVSEIGRDTVVPNHWIRRDTTLVDPVVQPLLHRSTGRNIAARDDFREVGRDAVGVCSRVVEQGKKMPGLDGDDSSQLPVRKQLAGQGTMIARAG